MMPPDPDDDFRSELIEAGGCATAVVAPFRGAQGAPCCVFCGMPAADGHCERLRQLLRTLATGWTERDDGKLDIWCSLCGGEWSSGDDECHKLGCALAA